MPRKIRGVEESPRPRCTDLVEELAGELKSDHDAGQPVIDEQVFPTGLARVRVLWDKWDHLPYEDRSATILRAYEQIEGGKARDRIALAIGLTIPEAYASGLLPFRIIPAVRKGDPVTAEQCRAAMLAEGASTLLDPAKPQLRFATEQEAEACVKRLIARLPPSEPVWVVVEEAARGEECGP